MTEIECDEPCNASIFKPTCALMHVLLAQLKSNDELRVVLKSLIEGVTLQLARTFGYSDDIFVNLEKEALEGARSLIDELNERFGQSPAYQVDQQVERVTRKRQRASKTPLIRRNRLESYASAQVNFEDRFVNDSIDSPMRGDIVPRRFDPNPAEVENPTQYVEEESLGDSTQQSVANSVMPDRAYVGGVIESVRDENSTAQHSEVTSVSFQRANGAMALRRAKSVVCHVENEYGRFGCAAGGFSLEPFKTKIENCIVSGNQAEFLSFLEPMRQLFLAKEFCANAKAMHKKQKAEEILTAVPATLANRDMRLCDLLHLIESIKSLGDDDASVVKGDWLTIKDAIRRRNVALGKRIKSERYYKIGYTLQIQMTIFLKLCIIVTFLSELRLCEFCDPTLLQTITELSADVPGLNTFYEMTVECFVKALVPALNSGDETLAGAALRILIGMVKQMNQQMKNGGIVQTRFEEAQRMRVNGSRCSDQEGEESNSTIASSQSHRFKDILNIWLCIILGHQIEAEFPPGFFARQGGFVKAILRAPWRNLRSKLDFANEGFFINLTSTSVNKSKAVKDMKVIVDQNNSDAIDIIISDKQHLEALKKLCQ